VSATATRIATLGRFVSQALSLKVLGEGLRAAEDRGFEPRRVLPPNRISSVISIMTGRRRHARDGTEAQARRTGKSLNRAGSKGENRESVPRTDAQWTRTAGHRGSSSLAGEGPMMRSIVVRAIPVSR
jgi:hypothetical protein